MEEKTMKDKKLTRKITLGKITIADLSKNGMENAKGGRTQLCETFNCTNVPCVTFDTHCSDFMGGATCLETCSPTVCGMYCVE